MEHTASMTDKHTPGPWKVITGAVYTAQSTGKVVPIASMDREAGNGTSLVEREANARLIAAAPELLKALEEIADRLKWGKLANETEKIARDAIKAANWSC